MNTQSAASIVERFSPATREWFVGTFARPTAAQAGAWEAISDGHHTLVVAPTGSGKTLSAFLWAFDQLVKDAGTERDKDHRCRVVYVSPMKALAVDVDRNLSSPLVGISHAAARLELPVPSIDVAVRSGDTTPAERRKFASHGADVLITTPESLFLLLTSAARERLKGVEYVIIDEIHALAGSKRGAHLAVSLDRLDALLANPAQRIGLSATVRPLDEVERFLAGGRPVSRVAPTSTKKWKLEVVVPVEDMADLAASRPPAKEYDDHAPQPAQPANNSIWPHVEEQIADLIESHTSTLVFANSRRQAERLTNRLNEIADERQLARSAEAFERANQFAGVDDGDGTDEFGTNQHAVNGPATQVGEGSTTLGSAPLAPPTPRAPRASTAPAYAMGGSGTAVATQSVIARAHHGSVSKQAREEIESDLKAGRLPAVVATSSLELGIDMGAIDLVIQIESPPSVASGLQRIGRAGHQVGATSHGIIFPKFRADLLSAAVVVDSMRSGRIESLSIPANPLDVLAQQIVAIVAMESISRPDLLALFRRSAPFASLSEDALNSVLDMLSGLYPSDAFRELRARIIWDRDADVLSARPGAQRLAVTSGGTIPDRGLFGVFLASGEGPGRRVGELDEEMVYESRVGDVFMLGTTSWRIEDITRDQVLVTPAPGQAARLPFWRGDALGRPYELGQAIGQFARELVASKDAAARTTELGLDERATRNLLTYLTEQAEATGEIPTDTTIIVERFRDELGDWRVVVHSPYGASVHAPWALAVSTRMREEFGVDVSAMHTDDGIVFRLLDGDFGASDFDGAELGSDGHLSDGYGTSRSGGFRPDDDHAGGSESSRATDDDAITRQVMGGRSSDRLTQTLLDVIAADPQEVTRIVTDAIGSTPLFASRFRECAARALLLPRQDPRRRQALWQQRQRAAQLLEVASDYPRFPIVLEAVRECLTDVYDLPGLRKLLTDIRQQRVRLVHVETTTPSPYAKSILFSYVAQFLYEGDSPLAERRATALSLDPELLADLLGDAGGLAIADLLDAEVVARHQATLQRLVPGRKLKTVEQLADALRTLGALTRDEIAARIELPSPQDPAHDTSAGDNAPPHENDTTDSPPTDDAEKRSTVAPETYALARQWWTELVEARRAIEVRFGGQVRLAAVEDAGRLRDGLGVALPVGVASAFLQSGSQPLEELLLRYAATRMPFTAADVATHFGLGIGVARNTLQRLTQAGRLRHGSLLPDALGGGQGEGEYCSPVVLADLRRLSLAAARAEVEPVTEQVYTQFLLGWQQVGANLRGTDGVLAALEPLLGLQLPASAVESLILPSRVRGYSPADLDALLASGDLVVQGHKATADDGWISFHLAEFADQTLHPPADVGPAAAALLEPLHGGGSHLFRDVVARVSAPEVTVTSAPGAWWELFWAGRIGCDTFAPIRARLAGGRTTHKPRARAPRSSRYARLRPGGLARPTSATTPGPVDASLAGRWFALVEPVEAPAVTLLAAAENMLTRYGVVTRGAVMSEEPPGGFAGIYRVLSGAEESGLVRRGYFIDRLGAAQFATSAAIDVLRATSVPAADTGPAWLPESTGTHRVPRVATVLAACDPANPFGAALAWPEAEIAHAGHRPGRKAGAMVVIVAGRLLAYLERGGRTVLTWPSLLEEPAEALAQGTSAWNLMAQALNDLITAGRIDHLTIKTIDGVNALSVEHPVRDALLGAGFHSSPQGLRCRR